MLFAYFGPDTLLPITSIVAAGAGALLMFGRVIWHTTARTARLALGRSKASAPAASIRRSAATLRRDASHATIKAPMASQPQFEEQQVA